MITSKGVFLEHSNDPHYPNGIGREVRLDEDEFPRSSRKWFETPCDSQAEEIHGALREPLSTLLRGYASILIPNGGEEFLSNGVWRSPKYSFDRGLTFLPHSDGIDLGLRKKPARKAKIGVVGRLPALTALTDIHHFNLLQTDSPKIQIDLNEHRGRLLGVLESSVLYPEGEDTVRKDVLRFNGYIGANSALGKIPLKSVFAYQSAVLESVKNASHIHTWGRDDLLLISRQAFHYLVAEKESDASESSQLERIRLNIT